MRRSDVITSTRTLGESMSFVTSDERAVYAPGGRKLRRYQLDAVDAVTTAHATGTNRPAVVLPTGTGKSTVIARLALETLDRGQRAVLLAHRGELLDQLQESVRQVSGGQFLPGIVQADRNEVDRPIVAATVQTLHREHRLRQLENVGLVVVDEAHRAAAPTYQAVLAGLGCFQGTPAAGFTATMSRGDDARLGDTWEEVVYSQTIRWAIDSGYLVEPVGKSVVLEGLDLDSVKRTGGDFQDGDLGELMGAHADAIAETWVNHAKGRKTMVFVPSVESAYVVADALHDHGAKVAVVVGETSRTDRAEIYDQFRDGDLDTLVSVAVLTEGFDEPSVNCVLMARPTGLHHVYVQAAGRGLRPSPGKTDCLILDVVGVSRRFPLTTIEDLRTGTKSTTVTPDGRELTDEEEVEAGLKPPAPLRDRVDLEDVDLFRLSRSAWLHTHKGVRFIPTTEEAVFLWPLDDEGTAYMPGTIRTKAPYGPARKLVMDDEGPMDLDAARTVAESYAQHLDRSISSRSSAWRQGARRPSEAQLKFARGLGIREPETFTKAALSDLMNTVIVSRLLDR